jgi:hypothetical protein
VPTPCLLVACSLHASHSSTLPWACPRQVCEANTCEDRNSTQCEIWGEAECANNPGAVMRECPKTCGVCTTVCADKEESCKEWASKGECEKNPASMLALCPQACGACHELEKFGKAKDEM